jgi:hypothetical protein
MEPVASKILKSLRNAPTSQNMQAFADQQRGKNDPDNG